MVNPFLWGRRNVLFLALPACLLSLVFTGPRSSREVSHSRASQLQTSSLLAVPPHVRQGRVHDWSTRHALYPQFGTMAALDAARLDPRSSFRWRETEQRPQPNQLRSFSRFPIFPRTPWPRRRVQIAPAHRDWAVYIGIAGTAPGMYPAKYTFDTTVAPNCANDFVVFPVNTPGSATQPSLVAFNNLYSGKIGATNGFCSGRSTGPGVTADIKTSSTVYWSYNISSSVAGAIATSPSLSLDGAKIAFVESISGKPAHFHVLAWKSGDGVGSDLQNALVPKTLTSFSATAPAAASGAATDLALGVAATGSDTLSSPFVDYGRDQAYVGNDVGSVYRINNVFCVLASCGGAAPSLDATWGTSGVVATGCTGKLTAPVLDFVTSNVYVGCSDGKLYSISQTGTVKSLVVGDGLAAKTYGAIVDPPVVDGLNGFVYVTSGSASSGANGVLVQAKMDLTAPRVANIGLGNECNTHAPTPNNAYFTNITSAGSIMYVGGLGTTGTVTQPCTAGSGGSAHVFLYGVTFGAGGVMNTGTPAKSLDEGTGLGYEWVPPLEFFNTTTSIDWLFIAAIQSGQVDIGVTNITAGFPTTVNALIDEGVGISGMVVDNAANTATFAQASSIYFNALQENTNCNNVTNGANTGGCAVKLTQSGLQ